MFPASKPRGEGHGLRLAVAMPNRTVCPRAIGLWWRSWGTSKLLIQHPNQKVKNNICTRSLQAIGFPYFKIQWWWLCKIDVVFSFQSRRIKKWELHMIPKRIVHVKAAVQLRKKLFPQKRQGARANWWSNFFVLMITPDARAPKACPTSNRVYTIPGAPTSCQVFTPRGYTKSHSDRK